VVVVVTGAAGHVGANLVRALRERGFEVRGVDQRDPPPALAALGASWVRASILDPPPLRAAFAGAEVVYHLAARISVTGDPDGRVRATNVDGVRNVAEAALAAGVRRLIHCSSVHAFDLERCGETLDETGPRALAPRLPAYDRSKAAGEAALRAVVERGLDAVIANPTGVVGPLDLGPSRMGRFFLALRDGRLPALVDGGFDWVDARDVAMTLIAAGERGRTGESYLVPGHWCSIRELAALAQATTGVPAPQRVVPMTLARAWGPIGTRLGRSSDNPLVFTGEALHALRFGSRVSGAKAERELGHTARPLEESVRDLYAGFRELGA
jgi:dihydroflavonol-4-reductase